jgi:hypothetical protein
VTMQKFAIIFVINIVLTFRVHSQNSTDFVPHPETLGNHFEGDIVRPPQMDESFQLNGIINDSNKWPKTAGATFVYIPYTINSVFNTTQQDLIKSAMFHIEQYTCIRFTPRVAELNYIKFISTQDGCYSYLVRLYLYAEQTSFILPSYLMKIREELEEVKIFQ